MTDAELLPVRRSPRRGLGGAATASLAPSKPPPPLLFFSPPLALGARTRPLRARASERERGAQNIFLRLLDARMPSTSRYFATVRRAIWIPSFLSRSSTIA